MFGAGRWRVIIRFGLVVVFGGVYALLWWLSGRLPDGPTAAQRVRAQVNRALPPGTPRPTVERWLSARGIEHFGYHNVADDWDLPQTGLNPDELGGIIEALLPDPARQRGEATGSVPVHFFFDKRGRSVKNVVKAD